MSWLKPALVLRALRQGHAAVIADADIAYTAKPLWPSLLAYIGQAAADGTWQHEGPANTGFVALLPTPGGTAFLEAWAAAAPAMLERGVAEQAALPLLEPPPFASCPTLCGCYRAAHQASWLLAGCGSGRRLCGAARRRALTCFRWTLPPSLPQLEQESMRRGVAVMRAFYPSHFAYTQHSCTIGSEDWAPRLDPCDWPGVRLRSSAALALPCGGSEQALHLAHLVCPPSLPTRPSLCSPVRACHLRSRHRPQASHLRSRWLLVHGR